MTDNQYSMNYNVDLVLCIDSTGSMAHIIDIVKRNALKLYADITHEMEARHKFIDTLRIRVISFRDYLADGENAMMVSDFFTMPEQERVLQDCVNLIEAKGGGDAPEDGLEALAYAIKSKWTTQGSKRRHIIVLWSDAATHEIGFGAGSPYYPSGMPRSFGELSSWWDDPQFGGFMNSSAKRMIVFAPDSPAWSDISAKWDQVIHVRTVSEGLREVEYQQVLNVIGNSI